MRPSELYGVTDEIAAYCFDRAVNHFGSALNAELNAVTGKTDKQINRKRLVILDKWIPKASTDTPK